MVAKKKPRRTQAERTAGTRKILLDATIKCLFEHGYSATTTNMVAEEAGISRGGMLHQFPSKADLMAFVVEAEFEEGIGLYHKLLAGLDDPRDLLVAYPDAAWQVLSRPSGVAMLEILLGSRSDPVLGEKLAPVLARTVAHARDELSGQFPGGVSTTLFQLVLAVARGLSIGQLVAAEGEKHEDAVRLFQQMIRVSIEAGLFFGDDHKLPDHAGLPAHR